MDTLVMKLLELELNAFRSVPNTLRLSLLQDGRPVSLIILGDNGSGKSSLVDALEFGLQGGVLGGTVNAPEAPTLRNMFSAPTEESRVAVTLSSGERVTRVNQPGERHGSEVPGHSAFSQSNFVIRRRDIAKFSQVAESDRPVQLVGYGRFAARAAAAAAHGQVSTEVASIREEIFHLEARKRDLENRLADEWDMARATFPRQQQTFDQLVVAKRGGRPGLSRQERRQLPVLGEVATKLVGEWRKVDGRIKEKKRIAKNDSRRSYVADLQHDLSVIAEHVTEAFIRLCPQRHAITKVFFFSPGAGRSDLELRIQLSSGQIVNPGKILSEASLDLLALLTLSGLTRAAVQYGQAKVLVLDDVFSSVDSTVRTDFAEYLFSEFADWQLVLTFHDRLWFEQFWRASLSVGHAARPLRFGRWSPGGGPMIRDGSVDNSALLRYQLGAPDADPIESARTAGYLLESTVDQLTVVLGTPMPRHVDNMYSLGDMWEPLRLSLAGRPLCAVLDDLDRLKHTRNLLSHSNSWARSLSDAEALDFSEAVLRLWDAVYCGQCGLFVRRKNRAVKCRCGAVQVQTSI